MNTVEKQAHSTTRSPFAGRLNFRGLKGRVAIVTGATRGIGKECALALAREGCHIVVAAKSTEEAPGQPGTIFSVARELSELGAEALPVRTDVLDAASIENCVEKTVERFGRLDIVINNASALWWQPIEDTPIKKYDLITRLNARGSFVLAKLALPHMKKNGFGRVICMSPPIATDYRAYRGITAYHMSKFGMSMVALGVAAEYEDVPGLDITGNALWPATVIESQAAINFDLGERRLWRKATVLADAAVAIICDKNCNGRTLIDDEYLMERGLLIEDLRHYRYDPDFEPPRMLAKAKWQNADGTQGNIRRGDVKKLDRDRAKDSISKL
uniref:Uncharacterized protein n=1 Tax=Corethron hystrix TaxID=216773 RepID=A0A7S1FU39_9STRA|mmetsp:Transcript_27879/g.63838  ORF Transcript_27879/g.63838 Transcript_27879/m.63838 type:complete len:329 (+) Transcript_27879:284-1270(+)